MKRILSILALGIAAMLMPACNGDIFIDGDELPDVTTLVIEGDGGQWSSAFSRKGLASIYCESNDKAYLTYYGINGGVVDADCPPSELKSIVYQSPVKFYEIGFEGDMAYFTSHYNASFDDNVLLLRFVYDYGAVKTIHIALTAGERLHLVGWTLSGAMDLEENFHKTTYKESFTNNGPLAQKLELMPFLRSYCSGEAIPSDTWAYGLALDMPMPEYNFDGEEWEWREDEYVRLGYVTGNLTPRYFGHKLIIDVPAGATAKLSCTLNYTRAIQKGTLQFYNATADVYFETAVTWASVYPVSYDYEVEYE